MTPYYNNLETLVRKYKLTPLNKTHYNMPLYIGEDGKIHAIELISTPKEYNKFNCRIYLSWTKKEYEKKFSLN